MMAPETGVDVSVEMVSEQFLAAYPRVRILGQLPRAARLIARADEPDQYVCPFDIAPHSRFTWRRWRRRRSAGRAEPCCRSGLRGRKPS